MSMRRRTVTLPEDIDRELEREAAERGMSVSAVLTEYARMQQEARPARKPKFEWFGIADFDDPDTDLKVDEILARGFGRD